MKLLFILLFSLVFSACTLTQSLSDNLDHKSTKMVVGRTDTLHLDQLPAVGKLKNKGTIIIQQGAGNVAAPVGKTKGPVSVAGHDAQATQELKSSAWLLLVLAAIAGVWAWSNYKK